MRASSLIRQFGFFLAKYCIYCFVEKTIVAFCNFQSSMNKSWAVHASDLKENMSAMWNIQSGQKYKHENMLNMQNKIKNVLHKNTVSECTKYKSELHESVKALLAFKEINIKMVAAKQLFMLKLQQCNLKKKTW